MSASIGGGLGARTHSTTLAMLVLLTDVMTPNLSFHTFFLKGHKTQKPTKGPFTLCVFFLNATTITNGLHRTQWNPGAGI